MKYEFRTERTLYRVPFICSPLAMRVLPILPHTRPTSVDELVRMRRDVQRRRADAAEKESRLAV